MITRNRITWLELASALVLVVLALVGCGATSASAPALGNDVVKNIDLITKSGNFKTPLDSTPDPDGNVIYFTATGTKGNGVSRVPAAGGDAVEVTTGAPFVAPRGISISGNGQQIYVADPQSAGANGKLGQIFAVAISGGNATSVKGTEGTAPQNLTVM